MPPDQAAALTAAAQRKRERALERAHAALRDLDQDGKSISFQAVARRAGVSRQWLYTQPELRAEIERLRTRDSPAAPRVPDTERAREASLRQRNTTLLAENRRLRDQIAELKTELAMAYGQRRAAN
jgi:Family of unknown function (DUF6262)/Basic region leucine zipper